MIRFVFWGVMALLALACGPAAPANQEGGDANASPSEAQQVAPGVGVLSASPSDRSASGMGSVRTAVPTPTQAATESPQHDPTPALEPTATPAPMPTPTPTEIPKSEHTELYKVVNAIRANPYVGTFPLEVERGLEVVAQQYAEGQGWNTGGLINGKRVEALLLEQDVRCRHFWVLSTGIPGGNPYPTEPENLRIAMAGYLPDFEEWAATNEDYATHLLYWIDVKSYWENLFLSNQFTHMGYGAIADPTLSSTKRGNHPGVMIVCEK